MADLQTLLSKFLDDLYGGLGINFPIASVTVGTDGIATTSTDGYVIQNTTASTVGVPVQQPARFRFLGHVWNETAVAADNTDEWWIESVPVSGATPSSLLKFRWSGNGAATTSPFTFSNLGKLSIASGGTASIGTSDNNLLQFLVNNLAKVELSSSTFSPLTTMDLGGVATKWAAAWVTSLNFAAVAISGTAPTIASGFGTTPSVVASNGTAAFTVNVGTGGTASAGVITMPAATTGWIANVKNLTALLGNAADVHTVQIASSTTSITVENQTISTGAAVAWAASDILQISAMGY